MEQKNQSFRKENGGAWQRSGNFNEDREQNQTENSCFQFTNFYFLIDILKIHF